MSILFVKHAKASFTGFTGLTSFTGLTKHTGSFTAGNVRVFGKT